MGQKNKSSCKRSTAERICRALDIPISCMPRKSLVEIEGDSRVMIGGGGKILLYSESEMRIALRFSKKVLSVSGEALGCTSYKSGALEISGRIISVSFCGGEKKR